MKKLLSAVCAFALCLSVACEDDNKGYVLDENTFFLVMTNVWYYPEQYVGKDFEYVCFTYSLTDTDGKEYICGVRKCSAGYGCKCGKDTVIGFIIEYDGDIPAPKNQYADDADKTWVRLKGKIKSSEKTEIKIYSVSGEKDQKDENAVETVSFLTFSAEVCETVADFSGLKYYVDK